jgi:hypothetical protein
MSLVHARTRLNISCIDQVSSDEAFSVEHTLTSPGMKQLCDCEAVKVPLYKDDYTFSNLAPSNAYFVTLRHDDEVAIFATSINKCEVEPQVIHEPPHQMVNDNNNAYMADIEMAEIDDDSSELDENVVLPQSAEQSAKPDAGNRSPRPEVGTGNYGLSQPRNGLATPSSPYIDLGMNADSDVDTAADELPQHQEPPRRRTAQRYTVDFSTSLSPEREMQAFSNPSTAHASAPDSMY